MPGSEVNVTGQVVDIKKRNYGVEQGEISCLQANDTVECVEVLDVRRAKSHGMTKRLKRNPVRIARLLLQLGHGSDSQGVLDLMQALGKESGDSRQSHGSGVSFHCDTLLSGKHVPAPLLGDVFLSERCKFWN
jgi:hypothetical protein